MSHKSWLKGLLQRVAKSSQTTIRKRPAFSPVNVEILEDRTTPVALDWTGAVNTSWNTAGNWVQNQVPSAANNILNFNSATPGVTNFTSNNNIAGLTGFTINIIDANAASDFTITGMNVGVTAVTHAKTDSQASSTTLNLGMTGAGAILTNTAGNLTILNIDNVFDAASNVNVPTGANLTVAVFPTSSVGNAKFNLTGGTLTAAPAGTFYTNAFNVGQNATANDMNAANNPQAALGTDVQLYPMMADISRSVPSGDTRFQTNTHTWGNNNTYFYRGEIFFPDSNGDGTGSIAFAEQNDDSTLIRIDGVTVLSNTTWNVTNVAADPDTFIETITKPTGWYPIEIRFGNGGGGAGPSNQAAGGVTSWVAGNGSTNNPSGKGFGYRVTDPNATEISENNLDAKLYRRLYASPSVYGINQIGQSGNTVTVRTAAPHTTTQMNSSVKVGDKVEITGVTPVAYNGVWTVLTVTGNDFTFAHPQSGLGNGTVNDYTTLTLPDDGTRLKRYGVDSASQSGTTVTLITSAPGTTTDMPSGAQVGDMIVISGATPAAYNGTWEVTAITGNFSLTFEHTQTGLANLTPNAANTTIGIPDDGVRIRIPKAVNGSIANAISVTGNSTIALDAQLVSATMGNLTMASGANLNVIAGNTAGQTLSLGTASLAGNVTFTPETGANLNFLGVVSETAASGITKAGPGTLTLSASNTYTGATTINAGTVNAAANNALGTVAGTTTVNSGGRLVVTGNYTTAEPLSINGTGSTATNGALSASTNSTFAGPITLAGNAWIAPSANTLTLTGGINAGSNQLTFAGGGDGCGQHDRHHEHGQHC